jgi:hypothetical protein
LFAVSISSARQFIEGGCEISLVVALDFTASNGHPAEPTSLHYVSPMGALNPYQQAIIAVGNVLQPYDTDQMVYQHTGQVSTS